MKSLVFLLLLVTTTVSAQSFSLRNCMILPITDSAGEVLGHKVFDEVENYLKRSNWCKYKTSSEILSIFSKYRDRLKTHLENPDVIKTVAKKLKVGSLIRVSMDFELESVFIKLEILSEDGNEFLYREQQKVNASVDMVSSKIIDWLEVYKKSIPYHARVIGVLGEQITFDTDANVEIGQRFEVRKLVRKKHHKLLKSVVQWDTELIAEGKVFNTSEGQSLGLIKKYFGRNNIVSGDWIVLQEVKETKISKEKFFPNFVKGDFGKLGELTVSFLISNASVNTSPVGKNIKYGNFIYGLGVEAEAWITREYFAIAELSRSVGSLDREGGVATETSPSTINGVFKLGGGYKYLPMGYFFGPQINMYAGYASLSYGLDQSSSDGIGEGILRGIYLGIGGNTPVRKGLRLFGSFEFMPMFTSFSDEDNVYSSSSDESYTSLEFGAKYKYKRIVDLKGSIEVNSARVKFSSGTSQVKYKDTVFKLGASFIF